MLWRRPPDAPPGSAPETGRPEGPWLAGRPEGGRWPFRNVGQNVAGQNVGSFTCARIPARAKLSCVIMLHPASYAPTLAAAVPPYWYVLAAVLIITPLYFLLSRPRKKRADSKWKG